jgi:aldehyde:ferredoxin oxidoreductase
MYAWAGKILWVDLSSGQIRQEPLTATLQRGFIGGRGINVKLLFDAFEPGTDAFDPANPLLFGSGPLVGTLAPGGGRFNVTTRSPLGYLGDSSCGGHWARELKMAGYDHIMIVGKAKKPAYLWIQDDQIELRDAGHLWGRDAWTTQVLIREELGDEDIQTVCIGPAGENLVRFANVRTGIKRSAGRTGTGAVMGSKNLKAIAVRGTQGIRIAQPEKFMKAALETAERIEGFKQVFGAVAPQGGTYGQLLFRHNDASMMATRHQQSGYWEAADALDAKVFHEKYRKRMTACSSCPVGCTPYFTIDEGPYKGTYGEIEYEAIASFGSSPDIRDRDVVYKAAVRADELGIDCDSGGRLIGFAMELYQRGIITEEDVGFPLHWGDGEAMLKLLDMIAYRQGFGDILAEGELRAGKIIGRGAEDYVLTMKGVEQHEPLRSVVGHALGQSTSTRGADHLRSSHHAERDSSPEDAEKMFGSKKAADPLAYEGKAPGVIYYEYNAALADMMETCKFLSPWLSPRFMNPEVWAELLTTASGIEFSAGDLLEAAERVINVERVFIAREGAGREDDYPPRREFEDPYPSGPFKGQVLDRAKYDQMLDEYYRLHSWDVETGIPTLEKLREVGLEEVAADLERRKIQ